MMTRLLLVVFGSLLGTAVAQCGDSECDYDILIIGCGASGVGAAREIENFNQNGLEQDDWVPLYWGVFETEGVCGGRARAAYYVNGADQNPLAPDLEFYDISFNEIDLDDFSYYDVAGQKMDEGFVADVKGRWKDTYRCLEEVTSLWFSDIDGPDDDIGLRNLIEQVRDYCPSRLTDLTSEIDWSERPEYDPGSGNIASGQEWFDLDFDSATLPNVSWSCCGDWFSVMKIPFSNNTARFTFSRICPYLAFPFTHTR